MDENNSTLKAKNHSARRLGRGAEPHVSSVFGTFTLLVSDVALLDAAYSILSVRGDDARLNIGVLPWTILAIASLLLYRLFLRRERPLPKAVLFLAVSYAVTVAALLIFFVRLPSFISTAIALIFWSLPQFRMFTATKTPPTLEKLTGRFEGVIAVLLLVLLSIIGLKWPLSYAFPCIVSLLLNLVSLIVVRTSRSSAAEGSGKRGVAVVFAFFLLVGVITAVFLLFAFASFGDTIAQGAAAILQGIRILFGLLSRALSWLVSLLPMPDYGGEFAGATASMQSQAAASEELISGGRIFLIIIVCIVAVLLVSFLIVAVSRFRRETLGGKSKLIVLGIKRSRVRSRVSFFRRFIESLRFFCCSILYRNTPQGLFVQLERWGKRRRCGRATGETQRSYLARISASVPAQKSALLCLADALDARWYGDSGLSQLPRRELVKLRRSFSVINPMRRKG